MRVAATSSFRSFRVWALRLRQLLQDASLLLSFLVSRSRRLQQDASLLLSFVLQLRSAKKLCSERLAIMHFEGRNSAPCNWRSAKDYGPSVGAGVLRGWGGRGPSQQDAYRAPSQSSLRGYIGSGILLALLQPTSLRLEQRKLTLACFVAGRGEASANRMPRAPSQSSSGEYSFEVCSYGYLCACGVCESRSSKASAQHILSIPQLQWHQPSSLHENLKNISTRTEGRNSAPCNWRSAKDYGPSVGAGVLRGWGGRGPSQQDAYRAPSQSSLRGYIGSGILLALLQPTSLRLEKRK